MVCDIRCIPLQVVYLSVVSFFDKRAEDKARKKFFEAQKSR